MDAVEFLKEFGRLCAYYSTNTDCKECPLVRYDCCRDTKNEDVVCARIVEQWAKEYPVKTRQSEFLKQWPEVTVDKHGVCNLEPCNLCPSMLNSDGCGMSNCDKCRCDFWLKEIE